jgi:CRP/FNR family transcriptional regulator, cyclic AMP receptor protein
MTHTRSPFSIFRRKADEILPQEDLTIQTQNYLLTMDIFRDLDKEVIAQLVHQTRMHTYQKGQRLYSQEDRAETLFLLKQGRIQLYRLTPSGKRLKLATISPGTFFGEMPLLGQSLHHAYAEAADNSLVCVMNRHEVEMMVREHPQVALRMMEVIGNRLAICEARLEEMAYHSVPARIAAVLLRLSHENEQGEEHPIQITHQELGEMIGALRESVTKVLDDFQRTGFVELSRGHIQIRQSEGLERLLHE